MGSLLKQYDWQKLQGVVYTPTFIVQKILDAVGYVGKEILGKTICDPACGDGRFLLEIAKRIIDESPQNQLAENLSYIHGWDIDENAVNQAKINLNELIRGKNITINWNIMQKNAIFAKNTGDLWDNTRYEFDFIVGNPPYIRIQHLDIETRQYLLNNYEFCQFGSTDIFIAFFELALSLCKTGGFIGFITPNSYFTTQSGAKLRDHLVQNRFINKICNYGHFQIFANANTYSAISILQKTPNQSIIYEKYANEHIHTTNIIQYNQLQGNIWNFNPNIPHTNNKNFQKLSQICDIHVGITTLADKVYIIKKYTENDKIIEFESPYIGAVQIERAILKPIIKASTYKTSLQTINELIIYPYYKQNGLYEIMPREYLQQNYPLAYNYFVQLRDILNKRDNGLKPQNPWYKFGRSQALNTSFGAKILFSPMNEKPNFVYTANNEATIYSGYFIKYTGNNNNLLTQLNSERMAEFIQHSARDLQGGWKTYSKKIIADFMVDMQLLNNGQNS